MNEKVTIRITGDCQSKLWRHLLRGDDAEHLAFGLAGCNQHAEGVELLVRDVILIPDDDLVDGARLSALELAPRRFVDVVNQAVLAHSALIELHNHPNAIGVPHFSLADECGFGETVPYMLSSLKLPVYSAVVVSQSGDCDGLVWVERPDNRFAIGCIDVVQPTEFVRRSMMNAKDHGNDASLPDDALAQFDRQVRAFGKLGQRRIATLQIAIVGLGGIGAVMAQLLSRLGVCRFVLIDPDVVELSNLSRIPGATHGDVHQGRPKVEVAARNIRTANPMAEIFPIPLSVYDTNAMAALAGTDLIISGTDDVGSRFAVNDVALAYLRPFLDLATEIDANERTLAGIGGRYTFTFPGDGCLICARAIDPAEAAADFVPLEVKEAQRKNGYIAGSDEPAASVMPLNSVVASLAAMEILVWAAGVRPVVKQMIYDGRDGTVSKVSYERSPTCDRCNEIFARGDLAGVTKKYQRWARRPA